MRQPTEAVISCRPYASHGDVQPVDGIIRNVSHDGIYIEASKAFKRGTILILRMVHYPSGGQPTDSLNGLRSLALAEVRWRRERKGEDGPIFGMGLRYFD